MKLERLAVISYHTCPLSDEDGAEIGGMNIYVLELSKELANKGCHIDIFTRSQSEKSPKIVQVSPTLRVIHLPAGPQQPIHKKELRQYIPEFLANFYAFQKEQDVTYHAISCHYFLSGLIGMDIKKRLGIPMLITFHTLALMKNLVARSDEEKEDLERIKDELHLVQAADYVIATSDTDALYLRSLYNCPEEKIAVLAPGVNLALFRPMDKKEAKKHIGAELDHKLIVFVGRIEPLKGIDVLLYALKIVKANDPALRICLWIVGGDVSQSVDKWSKELQKLEKIRKILNIATEVTFVGKKQQDELPYYYSAAEVVVMPSHYESFGITALEAMASGVPVITTDATGVSGIFDKKHAALVTSANNPLLLAEKIHGLLSDEKKYQQLSTEIYQQVQDLSWERVAAKFLSLCLACYTHH